MFGSKKFFGGPEESKDERFIVAQLNAKLMPIDRGDVFEDPLDDVLQKGNLGSVTGGGTMQAADPSDGIKYIDLEICVQDDGPETQNTIITELERLGAPKGSILRVEETGTEVSFGTFEGLLLSINGTDLSAEVYESSDINELIEDLRDALGESHAYMGYWQGPKNTDLFFYGPSYESMAEKIQPVRTKYPLCEKSVLKQIV